MIISKCLSILIMALMALTILAADGKTVQVKVRPITREQYDSILKISDGKPVVSEGRLISSAVSGLAGLAAGFQLSKLLPNLFATTPTVQDDQVVSGYPLCTINSGDITERQLEHDSYVDVDELTNALARPSDGSQGTLMNCIIVLDDGKDERTTKAPSWETTTPASTMETTTPDTETETHTHYHHHPHHPHYPHYPHHHPPPVFPPPVFPPPVYLLYPYPPPAYYPPPPDHPPSDSDEKDSQNDELNLHSFIIDKLETLTGGTTTTTEKPRQRRPRPHNRHRHQSRPYPVYPSNYPAFPPIETAPRRKLSEQDLNDYEDSIDNIEVSKKSRHH